jgi:hypothetical protein
MNIDRHNYEEYFLLYIDNELSVDQKKQVELFVKENPDMEEEWVMLQQSRLVPDNTIVFGNKHLLMKEENDPFINLNNYEEWLVLYVDDELKEEDKIAVEKFAAAHNHVQQELALFQQTRLRPEEIIFSDKDVLYRKEKIAVISLQWWKMAVAAVLIIAAGITLYSIFHKTDSGNISNRDFAGPKKEKPSNPVKSITPNKQEQTVPEPKEEKEQVVLTTPVRIGSKKQKEQPDNRLYVEEPIKTNTNTLHKKSDVIAVNSPGTTAESTIKNDITFKPQQFFKDSNVTKPPPETPQPIYAINTDNNGNKKFRGFFRKAARIIERTTNINPANDDNKVLIGGMAINLK